MIQSSSNLEHVYIVSDRKGRSVRPYSSPSGSEYITPDDSPNTNPTPPSVKADIEDLGRKYLHAFTHHHGTSLRHLLLSDQWPLSELDVTELIRRCPNLTQLGFAYGSPNAEVLRLLLPFLRDLTALRILENEFSRIHEDNYTEEQIIEEMGRDTWKMGAEKMRWVQIGKRVFRIGEAYQVHGHGEWRRKVVPVRREEVEHVEIWGLDRLDCMVDRGAGVG